MTKTNVYDNIHSHIKEKGDIMRVLYLEDIDLCDLKEIKESDNKESTLFRDRNKVYKIFDDMSDYDRECKCRKIELLSDGKELPITVMPEDALVYGWLNDRFEGYTMDYIKESKTLNKLSIRNKDIRVLLSILILISKSLEEIHLDSRNIVISDLHAENIIVDKNYKPHIIDIDSCKIDGIKNDAIPMALKQYLSNRNLFSSLSQTNTTRNTDRLCFLMMAISLIFNKHIDKISMYQYDEVSERINILKNMREIVLEVQKSQTIPEVPYFHHMIEDKTIIRKK